MAGDILSWHIWFHTALTMVRKISIIGHQWLPTWLRPLHQPHQQGGNLTKWSSCRSAIRTHIFHSFSFAYIPLVQSIIYLQASLGHQWVHEVCFYLLEFLCFFSPILMGFSACVNSWLCLLLVEKRTEWAHLSGTGFKLAYRRTGSRRLQTCQLEWYYCKSS